MRLYVDDFLTRRYWDTDPDNHGLGRNIPLDYAALSVKDELAALKALHAIEPKLMVFVVGRVLDMNVRAVKEALAWCLDSGVVIAGHGYHHTKQEYLDGYVGYAEKTLFALRQIGQEAPYYWRYPRHEEVNAEYVKGLGFTMAPYDKHIDPELLKTGSFECLRNRPRCWVHSCYLARVYHAR